MKRNSNFFAALTAILLLAPATTALSQSAQSQSMNAYVTSEDSRMWVGGTSTLHDWECPVNDFSAEIRAAEDGESLASIGAIVVTANVEAIECEKSKMNRKLQDALESDDFPEVVFEAESAEILAGDEGPSASAAGTLTMAGETRDLSVDATITRTEDGQLLLTGRAPILLSNFDIDPPSALLGTIKTGDEVFVRFEVVLTEKQAN